MATKKVAAKTKGAARPPKARSSGQSSSRSDDRSRDIDNGKSAELLRNTVEPGVAMTGNQGVVISDDQNSLKAGPRGPTLLEDFHLREKITHFDHERIPERVVHARGAAAHGVFELYEDLSEFTSAGVLNDTSRKTPVFVRFSTVAGSRGSADTPAGRARFCGEALHRGGGLGHRRQQYAGLLYSRRYQISRSDPRG